MNESSSGSKNNRDTGIDPIEQFLTDLAPRLPRKKRLDVMRELRSNLHDRAEELEEKKGMPSHTSALQAVSELGDPANIAAAYGGGRIIIPATRYHLFKVMAITLVAIHLAASILTTIVGLDITILVLRIPNMQGWRFYEIAVALATQALADIGLLTLLFWWAELSLPRQLPGNLRWSAAEAKPHWSGLIGPLIALGIVNVWRNDVLALHMIGPDGWQSLPILADSFVSAFLLPVNLLCLLALGVHSYKTISGPTVAVAGLELIYRLAVFALIGTLLGARQPFDLPSGQLEALEPLLTGLFRLVLLALLFSTAFAIYRAGARLAQRANQ